MTIAGSMKGLVVHIDGLDVLEARDGPVGPEGAVGVKWTGSCLESGEKRFSAFSKSERGGVDGLQGHVAGLAGFRRLVVRLGSWFSPFGCLMDMV